MIGVTDTPVHFVVPDGIDDPERVSGGNVYDQRIRDELRARGWDVRMVLVPEERPSDLAHALSLLPQDSLVVVDGLIAVAASGALDAHSTRLRIVVLAHMVDLDEEEVEIVLRTGAKIAHCPTTAAWFGFGDGSGRLG